MNRVNSLLNATEPVDKHAKSDVFYSHREIARALAVGVGTPSDVASTSSIERNFAGPPAQAAVLRAEWSCSEIAASITVVV